MNGYRKSYLSIFVLLMLAGGFIPAHSEGTAAKQRTDFFPTLDNYADLYLRGSYDVLNMIRVRELEKIGQACKIAAQRKLAGGTIYSYIWTPHIMYAGACDEDVPGNPNIAPDYKSGDPRFGKLPDLGAGDFLIVGGPGHQDIRQRGCFFLGIGYPMSTNRYSPINFNDHPEVTMESQVDMMIYTWGPKEDGIVTPSLTPHLKICPTSPMTVVGYWLVTAQTAHNLAYRDTSGTYKAAEAYLDTLMGRLQVFHERYIGDVQVIGEEIAKRVLAGGKIYPWSSRWEFYQEASGTAGSLMGIYPIHPEGIYTGPGIQHPPKLNPDELTDKDIVLLAMAGATPEVEIEMARKIRAKGAYMVGIYPFVREDGISTEPLRKLCNRSIDSLSGDKYGVLAIPGYPDKIIPTMAMMNNYAYWSIIGAYVQAMESRGVAPYYWMSWHVPGGKAYDDSIHTHFLKRGY
ncbi:hypothetical protein LLG96_11215 [bacterium]|nr:hypothetical protein [bacterium]